MTASAPEMNPQPGSAEGHDETRLMWMVFWTVAGLLCLNAMATLPLTPRLSRDEAEIVEYGRLILGPSSDGCMALMPGGRPETLFGWISCLAWELGYQITHHHDAPRVLALLGWLAAAALVVVWMRSRGVAHWLAGGMGLLMLMDPLAETPVRHGRPDAWAAALAFFAALLVRRGSSGKKAALACSILAGVVAGIIPWVWATGFLLLPIVMLEWWDARHDFRSLLAVLGGMAAGFILAALPVAGALSSGMQAFVDLLKWNAETSASTSPVYVLKDTLWIFSIHPFFLMLVCAGLGARHLRAWMLMLAALLVFMLLTRIYDSRYYYLIPFMLPLAAEGARRLATDSWRLAWSLVTASFAAIILSMIQSQFRWTILVPVTGGLLTATWIALRPVTAAALRHAALLPALVCGLWWIVGLRDHAAAAQADSLDYRKLSMLVEVKVGRGPLKVFCPYSLYFPGRQLGWRMFRHRIDATPDDLAQLWKDCEVILIDSDLTSDQNLDPQVLKAGFQLTDTFSTGPSSFEFGGGHYGPYRVYKRVAAPSAP
ncbi:MAG: hypothetical protein JNG86_15630 [Verrucomicrobiaceae bacterium]|nr:hypothetical protein [Verrucomicrobiaceae bacterium]